MQNNRLESTVRAHAKAVPPCCLFDNRHPVSNRSNKRSHESVALRAPKKMNSGWSWCHLHPAVALMILPCDSPAAGFHHKLQTARVCSSLLHSSSLRVAGFQHSLQMALRPTVFSFCCFPPQCSPVAGFHRSLQAALQSTASVWAPRAVLTSVKM
jgi:hypothetical protein